MYTEEAFDYLIENGVNVDIQTLRRWFRTGVVKATMNSRKKGYEVSKKSLDEHIRKKLGTEVRRTEDYQVGYKNGFAAAKDIYFTDELAELKAQLEIVIKQTKKNNN